MPYVCQCDGTTECVDGFRRPQKGRCGTLQGLQTNQIPTGKTFLSSWGTLLETLFLPFHVFLSLNEQPFLAVSSELLMIKSCDKFGLTSLEHKNHSNAQLLYLKKSIAACDSSSDISGSDIGVCHFASQQQCISSVNASVW